ncbi:MAG TPA: O-antigen ligase family protein [Terracidiphilus sp.]|jgi:O-antigen ligase
MKMHLSHATSGIADSGSMAITLSPSLLPACVGFFFAFRLFSVVLAVRIFGQDASVGVVASLGLNYLLFAIVAFHSIGEARRTVVSMLQVPSSRWVLLFICFTGASLMWSSTVSLPAAVAFWMAMAADTAMIVLLLRTGPVDAVVNAVMKGYVSGACAIAAIAWLLPAQSDLRLGDEELLGPNQIGYTCAIAFFFAQYLVRRKYGNWIVPAAFLVITLLRSLSKTTIIAFVAAQGYILLRDKSIKRKTKWLLAISALLIFVVFWSLLSNYFDVYVNAGNQSETLTGRVEIWVYILNEAVQQPWIGHGFHSVWKVIPPFGADQFEARHAHNELLQQFYAYGAVGVLMLVEIYGSLFRHLHRLHDKSMKTLFLGMLLFVAIRGLADTEVFDLSLPIWAIVMIGCLIEQARGDGAAFAWKAVSAHSK